MPRIFRAAKRILKAKAVAIVWNMRRKSPAEKSTSKAYRHKTVNRERPNTSAKLEVVPKLLNTCDDLGYWREKNHGNSGLTRRSPSSR